MTENGMKKKSALTFGNLFNGTSSLITLFTTGVVVNPKAAAGQPIAEA